MLVRSYSSQKLQGEVAETGKNKRFPVDGRRVYSEPRKVKTTRREARGMLEKLLLFVLFLHMPLGFVFEKLRGSFREREGEGEGE